MNLYGVLFSTVGGLLFPGGFAALALGAFFYLRLPKVALILMAVAGIWFGIGQIYQAGVASEVAKRQLESVETQRDEARNGLEISRRVAAGYQERAARLAEEIETVEESKNELVAEARASSNPCLLDDAQRLRLLKRLPFPPKRGG